MLYLYEIYIIYMKILNFRDCMKKYKLKNYTKNEIEVQRV